MSWPLIIGLAAGVIAADWYSQKIKREAKREEQNKLFNFENKIPSIDLKVNPCLPDDKKKVKVKKIKE